eukprot:526368_1
MDAYANEQAIEVREYQPVYMNERDDSSDELQTPKTYKSKVYGYVRNTIKICGYIIFVLDILYLVFLISLLHQGLFEYVREMLSGHTTQPILEIYAENCDFTWNNIKSGFDVWLIIHLINYILFTFSIRNRLFLWINSIIFEILEYTYTTVPIFNMQNTAECWYDTIIFDIFIFNALGIEIGLLILKYILKMFPIFPEWHIAFTMLCKDCQCSIKWYMIIFNLLFLLSVIQILAFAFYEYTFWIGSTHYLSIIRFGLLIVSCMPTFAQSYNWIFKDISCFSRSLIRNSYWIILIWCIIALEFVLTFRHYLF